MLTLITLLILNGAHTNYVYIEGYSSGEKVGFLANRIPGADITGKSLYLRRDAAEAWKDMISAAASDGIYLSANYGFRDKKTQKKLKRKNPFFAARPGYSDHQEGIAVDISGTLNKHRRHSSIWLWLHKNASRFNFYQPVKSESWHWIYSP